MRPVILALVLVSSPAFAAIELVTDGASNAEIVVPAGATATVRLAAAELTEFVRRSTGAELQTVATPTAGVPHVFLGPSQYSAEVGVTPDDLDPEGFHLVTVDTDVHIVGDDSKGDPTRISSNYPTHTGTLSGVYELLERVVGVRFLWHDELGTIVPRHRDLVIPELEVKQAPHWRYRALPYSPEGQTIRLFGRRLRLGQAYTMGHGHNWYRILPAEEYGEAHPEYFALVGGVRQARYYLGHHSGQVCTTNPEVIEIFARKAIEFFDQNPQMTMFSVSPNDGGGFCECDNCRALDVERWEGERGGQPVMTDRMLTFYNQIAEKVAAKHPDRYLGAYVYSYYVKPPTRVRPHPNLALVFAVNSAARQGVGWEREKQWVREWTALTDNFYQYDIFWLGGWCLGLPAPVTTHAIEKMAFLESTPMRGGYLYIGSSYESLGALHYVVARMMWDPEVDPRAVEREYYDALYGAASPDVKAWYDLLEGRLRKVRLEGVDIDEPLLADLYEAGGRAQDAAVIVAAYYPVLDQAAAILKRAAERDLDERQRQRLDRLETHARLLRDTVVAYLGAERLTRTARWDPDEVEAVKAAIEDRAATIDTLGEWAPTLAQQLSALDRRETARITPDTAAYRIVQRAGPTVVYATPTDAPPKIDGQRDAVWRAAAWRDLVDNRSGAASRGPASAALLLDGNNLYLFVEGWDEDGTKLQAATTADGSTALFDEDNVELFLAPPGDSGYYHVAVGAGGAVYAMRHPTGVADETAAWDAGLEAQVSRHAQGWNAELRLPLNSLEPRLAAGVEGWRVDVFRVRRGSAEPDEYTSLAPTFGGHHQPGKFAVLRTAARTDPSRFANGDLEGLDATRFQRLFRPQANGGATVEVDADHAYQGANTIRIVVPDGGLGGVTLTSPARAEAAYRITVAHRNTDPRVNPAVRPRARSRG